MVVVAALPRLSCNRATMPVLPAARLTAASDGPETEPPRCVGGLGSGPPDRLWAVPTVP
jgi:hypothetical protein